MPDGSGRIAVAFQINADDLKITKDTKLEIYSADLFTRAMRRSCSATGSVMAERGDTLLGDAQLSLTEPSTSRSIPLKRRPRP
jgi:hypothetical protein